MEEEGVRVEGRRQGAVRKRRSKETEMAGEERWRRQKAGLSEWMGRWERFLRCVRLARYENDLPPVPQRSLARHYRGW